MAPQPKPRRYISRSNKKQEKNNESEFSKKVLGTIGHDIQSVAYIH